LGASCSTSPMLLPQFVHASTRLHVLHSVFLFILVATCGSDPNALTPSLCRAANAISGPSPRATLLAKCALAPQAISVKAESPLSWSLAAACSAMVLKLVHSERPHLRPLNTNPALALFRAKFVDQVFHHLIILQSLAFVSSLPFLAPTSTPTPSPILTS
jgi:hypothetical protein